MPRTVVQKTNFLGGEAGPLLEGRSDLTQFQLGSRRQQNFIGLKGGAVTRRPGTRYITNTLGDKPGRVIPFVFSYNNGADCYAVEITQATTTTLEFRTIRVSDSNIAIPTNHTLTVDATLTNIDEIQFAQSADFLFLVHQSFEPQILMRTGTGTPDTFTLTPYVAFVDPKGSRTTQQSLPFLDLNTTATTMAISTAAVGAGRTLTFSADTLKGDATDVGKWFFQTNGATWGAALITAFTDKQHATATVVQAFLDTSASVAWYEGAWSLDKGFPRTICFYDQKLVFGGNKYKPDTFWMSKVGNYLQMSSLGVVFSINQPLNFQLASAGLNQIRWMVGGKKHTIGTSKAEWVGTVTNDGTNLFVQYNEETTHGSGPVQGVRSAYTVPFVQRSGQVIREMVFDFYSDSYQATDLNLFSSHIGTAGATYDGSDVFLKSLVYQESPNNIMWVIDSVGRLFGLTRDKQQQIAAWHSHLLGGTFSPGGGFVNSIAIIPSPSTRMDRLWMVVKRTINGSTKYHVEYMDDIKTNSTMAQGYAITSITDIMDVRTFVDCATYAETGLTDTDGHNQTVWAGYTRFASDNVYVVASRSFGIVFSGVLAVDGSGNVTLPIKAQSVVVGLHANAELRILPIEGGDAPKINTRSIKRGDLCAVKLLETYGLRVGKDRVMTKAGFVDNTTGFEAIPFDVPVQTGGKTFTGYKEFQIPIDADTDMTFALVMQEPWPCTILSISSRVVTNEI